MTFGENHSTEPGPTGRLAFSVLPWKAGCASHLVLAQRLIVLCGQHELLARMAMVMFPGLLISHTEALWKVLQIADACVVDSRSSTWQWTTRQDATLLFTTQAASYGQGGGTPIVQSF